MVIRYNYYYFKDFERLIPIDLLGKKVYNFY